MVTTDKISKCRDEVELAAVFAPVLMILLIVFSYSEP